ncbi:hypothetical protein J6TS2_48300 [Heyndrickxia sporothermodurans]|nr:hypothetical protein J6TS2_48300 [Heyndrickxia sporothermodurans]
MIGSSCLLYKTCKICGQTKWYKCFESKGKRKRRAYCKLCKSRKNEIKKSASSIQYKFDTNLLKKSEIIVRLKLPSKKRIKYKVSYEQAVLMVEEGMAGIVDESYIHKFYDYQTFKKLILKRDNFTCCYCGKFGDTIDHIKPKSNGGISSFNNCICACEECNINKDNLSLEEYLYYIEPISVSGNIQIERLEQQLHYLLQIIESINSRISEENYSKDQNIEGLSQMIQQVENTISKIKGNILISGGENHLVKL